MFDGRRTENGAGPQSQRTDSADIPLGRRQTLFCLQRGLFDVLSVSAMDH